MLMLHEKGSVSTESTVFVLRCWPMPHTSKGDESGAEQSNHVISECAANAFSSTKITQSERSTSARYLTIPTAPPHSSNFDAP